VFSPNVTNVAAEAYFYELPADVTNKIAELTGVKDQHLERFLAYADSYAKTTIDEILDEIGKRRMSPAHRKALAILVALQFSRTTLNRELLRESYRKLGQSTAEELIKKKYPEETGRYGVRIEFNEDTWALEQARQILSEEHICKVASSLDKHIWVFGINETIQPFYTSDHPVVRSGHCNAGGIELTGFKAPGNEVVYPLNSRCALYMLDPRYFRHMQVMDGRTNRLDPHDVEYYNALQVRRCFRQVYCERDEFDQARGVCKRYPECCDPNRSRVKIVKAESDIRIFFLE
jgi:Protein of unknown function (DUF4238)